MIYFFYIYATEGDMDGYRHFCRKVIKESSQLFSLSINLSSTLMYYWKSFNA